MTCKFIQYVQTTIFHRHKLNKVLRISNNVSLFIMSYLRLLWWLVMHSQKNQVKACHIYQFSMMRSPVLELIVAKYLKKPIKCLIRADKSVLWLNESYIQQHSVCQARAKKCHTLVKSFHTYKSETLFFFMLIIVRVKGNLENYTTWKFNPTNDSLLSSSMCQKGLNRNH